MIELYNLKQLHMKAGSCMKTFEEIEHETIALLNANVDTKIMALADMLLTKALGAKELEDKLRITAKANGVLRVVDTYGEQLSTARTFAEVRSIVTSIHTDFLTESSEATARGMEQAAIVILDFID
jgi:hypothetical protein